MSGRCYTGLETAGPAGRQRPVRDPFDFAVYLAFSGRITDAEFDAVRHLVVDQLELSCCWKSRKNQQCRSRCSPTGVDEVVETPESKELIVAGGEVDDDELEAIHDGVELSEKCLVCVTAADRSTAIGDEEDLYFKAELNAIRDKADSFGRDFVIVLEICFDGGGGNVENDHDLKNPVEVTSTQQQWPTIMTPIVSRALVDVDVTTVRWQYGNQNNNTCINNGLSDVLLVDPKLKPMPEFPKRISGYHEAFIYYYDFLRLVVPPFHSGLDTQLKSMKLERSVEVLRRMLIVIPDSCRIPPSVESDRIQNVGSVKVCGHRGGNKDRVYMTPLFKLTVAAATSRVADDAGDNVVERTLPSTTYCAAVEFPAVLLTMYEIQLGGCTGLSVNQLYNERDVFFRTLEQILRHPVNEAECANRYKLVKWNDFEEPNLEEFLCAEVERCLQHQKTCSQPEEHEGAAGLDGGEVTTKSAMKKSESASPESKTFEPVSAERVFILVSVPFHVLSTKQVNNRSPRRICLIIDIRQFDDELFPPRPAVVHQNLVEDHNRVENETATAAADDKEIATAFRQFEKLLGETLNFDMRVLRGRVTQSELVQTMVELGKLVDHSPYPYDAFFCCVWSYGRSESSVVYTSDGKEVNVVCGLAEPLFDVNCRGLVGKPKVFCVLTLDVPPLLLGNSGENTERTNAEELVGETLRKLTLKMPSSKSSRQVSDGVRSTVRDAIGSQGSLEAGEHQIPPNGDFVVLYANLQNCSDASIARRHELFCMCKLTENLARTSSIDVEKALNEVAKCVRDEVDPMADVVSTAKELLFFSV